LLPDLQLVNETPHAKTDVTPMIEDIDVCADHMRGGEGEHAC